MNNPVGIKQMMWPVHSQIGTIGHEFLPGLLQEVNDIVVYRSCRKENSVKSEDEAIAYLDAHTCNSSATNPPIIEFSTTLYFNAVKTTIRICMIWNVVHINT